NSSMPSILYNNIITSNIYILSLHDALPIYYIYSDRGREFPASDNLLGNINLTFGVITAVAGFFATLLGGWTGDWLRKRFANSYFLVSSVAVLCAFPATIGMLYIRFPGAWICIFFAVFFLLFIIVLTN